MDPKISEHASRYYFSGNKHSPRERCSDTDDRTARAVRSDPSVGWPVRASPIQPFEPGSSRERTQMARKHVNQQLAVGFEIGTSNIDRHG
jgi:hypothetical protein